MDRGAHDPELADDLVGVTSARLVAAGVPREERAHALQLLSILATLADGDSRVRRPLVMVASEFDLPMLDVGRWCDHLVAVGAVELAGDTIVVSGREPSRHVGITLHDFLDTAAELDHPRRRVRASLLRPSGALAAAAAIVALAIVGSAFLDDRSTTVSNTRGDTDDRRTTLTSRGAPTTTGTVAGARGGATTTTDMPGQQAPDTTTRAEPSGPVVASTTTSLTLPCPVGSPLLDVLGSIAGADDLLAVNGTAHNPTSHHLTIRTFTLRAVLGEKVVEAPWIGRDLDVPAGETVAWQSRLPVVPAAGTIVEVALGEWEWDAFGSNAPCASP